MKLRRIFHAVHFVDTGFPDERVHFLKNKLLPERALISEKQLKTIAQTVSETVDVTQNFQHITDLRINQKRPGNMNHIS